MSRDLQYRWKGVLVTILIVGVLVGVFLIQSVMMVRVEPIVDTPPPAFILDRDSSASHKRPVAEVAGTADSLEVDETRLSISGESRVEYTLEDLDGENSPLPYIALMKDEGRRFGWRR